MNQGNKWYLLLFCFLAITPLVFTACDDDSTDDEEPVENNYRALLSNQVNFFIIPAMERYNSSMNDFVSSVTSFATNMDETSLEALREDYQEAYVAYQSAAVHNYFATANQALITTTNLYPVDVELLASLIETESYNFNTQAQERANGFPAIDFMLYGPEDVVAYFNEDAKRWAFLSALANAMKEKSEVLVDQWNGDLKTNYIENGGTALGSSISVQLNESLIYIEDHVRENKVGIPIGRLGPNDSPIPPDPTKIEAYYQSLHAGNDDFPLLLVRTAISEMVNLYTGETSTSNQGYDDLLVELGQESLDTDIRMHYQIIFDEIENRSTIAGDDLLYQSIQNLITIYKSDLLPVLNVQDADGANDGD